MKSSLYPYQGGGKTVVSPGNEPLFLPGGVRLKTHPCRLGLRLKPNRDRLKMLRDESSPPNCYSFETREAGWPGSGFSREIRPGRSSEPNQEFRV